MLKTFFASRFGRGLTAVVVGGLAPAATALVMGDKLTATHAVQGTAVAVIAFIALQVKNEVTS